MSKSKPLIVLALALLVLALGAVAAKAALEFQARQTVPYGEGEEEVLEDVIAPATLDATQVEAEPIKFSIGSTNIRCTTATATAGLETGTSPNIKLAPVYEKCRANIIWPAEIAVNSCSFAVHSLEETEADSFKAATDVACPTGKSILIAVKNFAGTKTICPIHVYPQSGLKTVTVTNMTEASPPSFTVKPAVETLEAIVTKGEEPCWLTPGTYTNAKLTGTTNVTATVLGETPPAPPLQDKAQAGNVQRFEFEAGVEDVGIFGKAENVQELGFEAGTVTCKKAPWEMGLPKAKTTIWFQTNKPYEECEFGGAEEAEVLLNSCNWYLERGEVKKGVYEGSLRIGCGKTPTEVKFTECTITILTQGAVGQPNLRKVTFEKVAGPPTEVKAKVAVKGIKYEEKGAFCKHPNKMTANGTYEGRLIFWAVDNGSQKQTGLTIK